MNIFLTDESGVELSALPCPFCGQSRLIIAHGRSKDARYFVFCQACGTSGPPAQRRLHAVFMWNTRAAAPPTPQEEPQP